MKHKIILILIILCVIISAAVLISETAVSSSAKPDTVEINRIKQSVEGAESFDGFFYDAKYDFTVVKLDGTILYRTKETPGMSLAERINQAIQNYDTVIDYKKDGNIEGKIFIYTGMLKSGRTTKLIAVIVPFIVLSLLLILYYFYMRVYLYRPFKKLKKFAADIATGDLDLPLPMDKDNLFGEFTESFDLMRDELKAAKQKAILEERSKKELIATLSHDIKTPVSIVRAAGELLEINEKDGKKLAYIKTIRDKTFEIDRLVTDLFSSALNDLSELKINIKDVDSLEIKDLIISADQFKKIIFKNTLPECLVRADPFRLSQVFSNIISNSNKYAETDIEVYFELIDNYLHVAFKDFGSSFEKGELLLIRNKFYRGKNAQDKQGAGLGLYICTSLVERMGGKLDISLDGGFRVDIALALS
ncbi:MAG: HAMP domain-containing histidine kinase [Firmicutes bacterium]|nr:HAMP domain-containing histidine kinase [Bacillota bacterium]